jgi:hypothetical protein
VRFIPYFWLTQMHGNVTLRGETSPVDISFGKTWDIVTQTLDFAVVGQLEATYGSVGLLANGIYAQVSPGTQVRRLRFDGDFSQTVLDLAFTYDLADVRGACGLPHGARVELLAGTRYNSLTGIVTLTGPRGRTVTEAGATDWFDPIVGARVRLPLRAPWTLLLRGDVGGFGLGEASDFTWNIEAAVEYRWSERCSLFAGYRWLDIDRSKGTGGDTFRYDMRISGPMMGFAIDF